MKTIRFLYQIIWLLAWQKPILFGFPFNFSGGSNKADKVSRYWTCVRSHLFNWCDLIRNLSFIINKTCCTLRRIRIKHKEQKVRRLRRVSTLTVLNLENLILLQGSDLTGKKVGIKQVIYSSIRLNHTNLLIIKNHIKLQKLKRSLG